MDLTKTPEEEYAEFLRENDRIMRRAIRIVSDDVEIDLQVWDEAMQEFVDEPVP